MNDSVNEVPAIEPSNELPTPKYRIGQTVYYPTVECVAEDQACPDCLGTKKWKVVTPAGLELECPCHRCARPYYQNQLPKLIKSTPIAKEFYITDIEVRTKSNYGDDEKVRYYSNGSSLPEGRVHATAEEAMELAKKQAGKEEEKRAPETAKLTADATLTFNDARVAAAEESEQKLRYAVDNFINDICTAFSIYYDHDAKVREFLKRIERPSHRIIHDAWVEMLKENELWED